MLARLQKTATLFFFNLPDGEACNSKFATLNGDQCGFAFLAFENLYANKLLVGDLGQKIFDAVMFSLNHLEDHHPIKLTQHIIALHRADLLNTENLETIASEIESEVKKKLLTQIADIISPIEEGLFCERTSHQLICGSIVLSSLTMLQYSKVVQTADKIIAFLTSSFPRNVGGTDMRTEMRCTMAINALGNALLPVTYYRLKEDQEIKIPEDHILLYLHRERQNLDKRSMKKFADPGFPIADDLPFNIKTKMEPYDQHLTPCEFVMTSDMKNYMTPEHLAIVLEMEAQARLVREKYFHVKPHVRPSAPVPEGDFMKNNPNSSLTYVLKMREDRKRKREDEEEEGLDYKRPKL